MGSSSNESFAEFLDSLKKAGVAITNERELRARLAETELWRYAFKTLVANGRSLGIRFEDQGASAKEAEIRSLFSAFRFPDSFEAAFEATLKASHH